MAQIGEGSRPQRTLEVRHSDLAGCGKTLKRRDEMMILLESQDAPEIERFRPSGQNLLKA